MATQGIYIKFIESRARLIAAKKEDRELTQEVRELLGDTAQSVDVEGYGQITVQVTPGTRELNVTAACAKLLDIELAKKADRKAQLAQLEKALRSQGHKAPQKTSRERISLRITRAIKDYANA
jgi:hypothetical protein